MFNIWIGRVNVTVLMLMISIAVILPVQLLLCFKVRSRRLRFMPAIILFLSAAANIVMCFAVSSWKRQVFIVGAGYTAFMLLMCGLGWAVWVLVDSRGGVS